MPVRWRARDALLAQDPQMRRCRRITLGVGAMTQCARPLCARVRQAGPPVQAQRQFAAQERCSTLRSSLVQCVLRVRIVLEGGGPRAGIVLGSLGLRVESQPKSFFLFG